MSQTDASTAKGLEKYGKELMEVRQRVVASTAKGFVGGLNPLDPARRLPLHFTYWWRMSIYRPCDLLLAITRPPWQFRYIGFGKSVYRLGWGRSTDRVRAGIPTHPNPVYRLARLGLPTHTHSVDRHCQPPGGLPIPAKGRINTTVGSDQYHGMVGSIRRYRRFLRLALFASSTGPFGSRFRPFSVRRLAQFATSHWRGGNEGVWYNMRR